MHNLWDYYFIIEVLEWLVGGGHFKDVSINLSHLYIEEG